MSYYANCSDEERRAAIALFEAHRRDFPDWRRFNAREREDIMQGRCLWVVSSPENDHHAILDYGGVLKQ